MTELLQSKRAAILARWNRLALEVYPEDAARFMRREKDRFQNPVGARPPRSLDESVRWAWLDRRAPAEME